MQLATPALKRKGFRKSGDADSGSCNCIKAEAMLIVTRGTDAKGPAGWSDRLIETRWTADPVIK